jgi:hypothetical protein
MFHNYLIHWIIISIIFVISLNDSFHWSGVEFAWLTTGAIAWTTVPIEDKKLLCILLMQDGWYELKDLMCLNFHELSNSTQQLKLASLTAVFGEVDAQNLENRK